MLLQRIIEGNGIPLMLVGMTVVFVSLILLMIIMMSLKNGLFYLHKVKFKKIFGIEAMETEVAHPDEVQGTLVAAIIITLILEEEETHDEESLVLTLQSLPKPYSNWWMPGSGNQTPIQPKSRFIPTMSGYESTL